MILSNHYVPFLKWRQSEYQALFKLKKEIKDLITPYIIMPPIEYDFEEKRLKKTIQEHIEPMPKRLKDKWGSRLALLDFHDSIEQGIMDNGENVIKYVYTKSLAMGCKLIPVISFEKSKWYLTEIKSIISTQNCGLALRLFLEDLDKPNINGEIDQVLEMFDLNINNDGKRNGFQKNFNQDIKSHIKQFHPEHKGKLPSFHDLRSHFVSKFLNGKNDDTNKLIELKKLIGHTNKDLHKDITIEVYYREPMEIKYSKQLMDNIDLKIDKGYKHIKEMMNEKYNNIILKDLTI